jgi:hypothetical protein
MTDVASLVSATSVMLAAYGFGFNACKDQLAAARALRRTESASRNAAGADEARRAAWTAFGLAGAAVVPAALLLPEVVTQVRRARAVQFSLHHYQPVPVVFTVLAVSWWAIALALALDGRRHRAKARALRTAAV